MPPQREPCPALPSLVARALRAGLVAGGVLSHTLQLGCAPGPLGPADPAADGGDTRRADAGAPLDAGDGGSATDAGIPASLATARVHPLQAMPAFALVADGESTYALQLEVHGADDAPLAGVRVTFHSDTPGALVSPSATTDALGRATGTLAATQPGPFTVGATLSLGNASREVSPLDVRFLPCQAPAAQLLAETHGGALTRCVGCHNEYGLARAYGLSFQLKLPGDADFETDNLAMLRDLAQAEVPTHGGTATMPRLLAKPLGVADEGHLGGRVFEEDSPEHQALASLAHRLRVPDACDEVPDVDLFAGVSLRSPRETLVRAQLALRGEAALPEEVAAMPDTEDALAAALEGLMNGPEFALRVEEIANDWLLTDALRRNPVRPLNQLAQRDYPRRFFFREGAGNATCTPAAQGGAGCCSEEQDAAFCARGATLAAEQIAREPLELIAWLAAQDRSMKEILTYDRLRVSPFTAHVYGVQEIVDFPTGAADEARRPVSVQDTAYNNVSRNRAGTRALPHAGILSTLAVLNRYPSTDSNRQRTRAARLILERMLAVPVNQFADFVTSELDPDADLEQATQSAMPCIVCHTAMDPIAGHFDAFRSNLAFTPARVWPDYLPAPSFFDAAAPGDADLLPWLAAQVAEHPRFAYALVRPFFEGLTGHPVLSPPADLRDVDFAAKSAAFVAQNTYLTQLAERFATQHSHRLRPLLQDILTGPYFRAHHIDEDLAPEREAALAAAGIGGGLPLTNEQLHRKIRSATGFEWRVNGAPAGAEELRQRNRFAILYGGIDSDEITERFRTHFPVQLGIVRRMSYEMACLAVPRDFSIRQPAARRLFRHVSAATTETNDAPAIRAQIRRLQQILWGAYADDGDVELAAALQLFAAARAAGTAAQAAGEADPRLPGRCQVTQSWAPAGEATPYPATPAEGDTHERVVQDPQHVVRAWMAVFSYLLADPRFFQE